MFLVTFIVLNVADNKQKLRNNVLQASSIAQGGHNCMAAFSINALAVNDTASATKTSTPDGTGSVVSDTANGDGKEFLTIKASDGHIFYLIIDKQKTGDNVYFLNTVTTKDLLSLTQSDSKDSGSSMVNLDFGDFTATGDKLKATRKYPLPAAQ